MAIKKVDALSRDEMREVVRQYVQQHGTLAAAAENLSTSASHLSDILAGSRSVGDAIAAQLGFEMKKQKKQITVTYYIGAKK